MREDEDKDKDKDKEKEKEKDKKRKKDKKEKKREREKERGRERERKRGRERERERKKKERDRKKEREKERERMQPKLSDGNCGVTQWENPLCVSTHNKNQFDHNRSLGTRWVPAQDCPPRESCGRSDEYCPKAITAPGSVFCVRRAREPVAASSAGLRRTRPSVTFLDSGVVYRREATTVLFRWHL